MGILSKINLTQVVIIIALLANLVLVSILFYLIVPTISPVTNPDRAARIVNAFLEGTTTDGVVYWRVQLEANSRTAVAFKAKDPKDADSLQKYVAATQIVRFTSAITPEITKSLLTGDGMCYLIRDTGISAVVSVFEMLRDYPDATACVIPHKNSSGILNSYVLLIWKNSLTEEEIRTVLTQGASILSSTQ